MTHAWCFQIHQVENRPRYFNVTEYEKFIDMVSESTLQLTFKKLPPAKFWWSIKEYPELCEKLSKYFSLFQLRICCSNYFKQNNVSHQTEYRGRYKNLVSFC